MNKIMYFQSVNGEIWLNRNWMLIGNVIDDKINKNIIQNRHIFSICFLK